MVTEVVMPSAGQISDRLRIIRWCKKVGDEIKKGEILFEIETDKATMEIESYRDGVLLAVLYPENHLVEVGQVVAYIGEKDELLPENVSQREKPEKKTSLVTPEPEIKREPRGKPLASPLAKRLAQEHHLDLRDISQIFPKAALKGDDVRAFLQRNPKEKAKDWYSFPLSPVRKAIAQRAVQSVSSIPHYTISIEVEMSECINLRQYFKENFQMRISYNDLIMKCAAQAVEKYPLVNAAFEEEQVKVYTSVNFGLVVRVEDGLLIPVVKEVGRKSLLEVAQENEKNIQKARNGELTPEDLALGTITLSNLGMYGIDRFVAIINPPQTCILAVGKIAERPVYREGKIVARPLATITASFDHRLIDGAYGAEFLVLVQKLLEDPWFLAGE
ncbi:MAG: dihydrolipoamide acetyltransferase family protein [Atribacterota bacterium]